jgi:hypothetical protein
VKSKETYPYCYPPVGRVRELLIDLGWEGKDGYSERPWELSRSIYDFLGKHLDDPTFGCSFDLPLLALAGKENSERRRSVLGD